MMRVLLVSYYYAPEIGAAPSRITNMAEGLRCRGADVDVLTCLPNYPQGRIFDGYKGKVHAKETMNGINVYRYWTFATVSKNPVLRAWGMLSFALVIWLFAFKRKQIKSYDRVIVQSPPLFVSCSAILLFRCLYRRKTILNISDLWPLSAVELGAMKERGLMYKVFAKIERFIYKNADAIFAQSNEIIKHVDGFGMGKSFFLYRNLQKNRGMVVVERVKHEPLRIVYAGLLGVAQDILRLIKNIDFNKEHVEFHIYGAGNQTTAIQTYLTSVQNPNVYYHGFVEKEKVSVELKKYDVSIVPLVVRIKGAVPSKIFDLLPLGIPILFCGGGEGAQIVKKYGLGLVSDPGDYEGLLKNIRIFRSFSKDEYARFSSHCLSAASSDFDFNRQMDRCYDFLKKI